MLNRRVFLSNTAVVGLIALAPRALSAAAPVTPGPVPGGAPSPALLATFDRIFERDLGLHPETATTLGLDNGARYRFKSRLGNQGSDGRAAERAATRLNIRELEAFRATPLNDDDRISLETVLYSQHATRDLQQFDYGDCTNTISPYVVSPLSGSCQWIPDFLDTRHSIDTKADAEAYLDRLAQFATAIDQNTARWRHDVNLGVTPPDYLLDTTIAQLVSGRAAPDKAQVVTSLASRAQAKGLGEDYGKRAERIYHDRVGPAIDRQVAFARALRTRVGHDGGVWRFRDGAAYYDAALRGNTTVGYNAEEVHAFGLDQAAAIRSRIDGLLKEQGFTKGSIGERLAALYQVKGQGFPNTDAGKVEAIAYANACLDAVRAKLRTYFSDPVQHAIEVRRVPPQVEAGSPFAYSEAPPLDGSRPGYVWINLQNTATMPKFCLATTVYHEGLPGHQLETGLYTHSTTIPLIRKMLYFSGYAEGWALYAEQLADEIGMYDDDPLGRIGYLKFQLFRANRCVVDTGLHHMRWSREKAIDYFVQQDGEEPNFAQREIDRYTAMPGQACGYKLGHSVFQDIRERAKTQLGARFDLKSYHRAVLQHGRVPLDVLRAIGDRWIASLA